jgi:hypothetical protein
VYPIICDPPLFAGGLHEIRTEALPAVAKTSNGGSGKPSPQAVVLVKIVVGPIMPKNKISLAKTLEKYRRCLTFLSSSITKTYKMIDR